MATDPDAPVIMRLSARDNIAVALRPLKAGESVMLDGVAMTIERNMATGHKIAAQPIASGDIILKYNCPIGRAKRAISPGQRIGDDNVETDYLPTHPRPP